MSSSREIKQLQKAKSKAQANRNLKEEANICNQLGELLSRTGDYEGAIREHQQELALSEALNDVIGRAVANRKIGECYAETGKIEAALKHQRCHLDLARSVGDHAEEQRALATIGRTFLFRYESDQSKSSLKQAEDAFRKSLAVVDERLGGTVPEREIREMKARLFLNLGLVCDHLGEPKRCSEFIRRSVFIAEKSQLLEDLYRANFNLGNIFFRNGEPSSAVRCLEQAKDCARKMKDKFSESECFHCIGKVQLYLGDFVAARRSLKKALLLGSQQPADKMAVKKAFKYADKGCRLEEELSEDQGSRPSSRQVVELTEQLGDLCCKVGCYSKALDAYRAQLTAAEALGKSDLELAVIHVSLAATHTDLRQHRQAVEHYRKELALRHGSASENSAKVTRQLAVIKSKLYKIYTFSIIISRSVLCCIDIDYGGKKETKFSPKFFLKFCRKNLEISEFEQSHFFLSEIFYRKDMSEFQNVKMFNFCNSFWNSEISNIFLEKSGPDVRGFHTDLVSHSSLLFKNCRSHREMNVWVQQHQVVSKTFPHVANKPEKNFRLSNVLTYWDLKITLMYFIRILSHKLVHKREVKEVINSFSHFLLKDSRTFYAVLELAARWKNSIVLDSHDGETPMDTLRHWQRTYRKELDEEARQECLCTEKLLRKAAAGGVPAAPAAAKPFDALQDSQLFDAENSEPLLATRGRSLSNQDRSSPRLSNQDRSSPRQRPSSGTSKQHRTSSSSSDSSDSDSPVSPLRPVRPRHAVPAAPSQKENPSAQEPLRTESTREAPAPCVFQRDEYHSAIRSLGSAKTLRQALSQPQFSSAPTVSSALVPEDEYLADDWLEDDLGEMQPKKKRRLRTDFNEPRREEAASSLARSAVSISSSRGLSQRKNGSLKPHQVKVTQMPGMVRLGTREPLAPAAPIPASLPPPIRMRVKVQEDVFLIPVPQSEADSCTVSWLCEQAAQRYYQKCGLLPRLSLQKEGALLSPQDLLLAVLHTNEEVLAEVCSWDLPPLPDRYRKACQSLAVDEDRRVSRLCEVQDGGQSVSLCGLSLAPASLNPLLRALKLQASLTELRLSGNRLHDDLLPELVATTTTMPRLRLLDVSANGITGEGLEKAVEALKGQSHPAYAYLEELDLSLNPLGDGVVESLSCLLSSCPLLSRLSLQACRLTARFLQQHRLLLAAALTGLSHLKSVSLSHNALGSTGFELVLKTLPLQTLTHLDLAAVHRGPADHLALQHLAKLLSQGECPLTHLSLAGNGLMDSSVTILARCLPSCPTLTSLDLSGNPSVSWSGLHSILTSVREASRPLTFLNLQGCQVSGPWSSEELDGLSELVQDLRLCSQGLNKLDRDALRHSWGLQDGRCVNRNARFLLSATAASS
uniref:NF-kappa-B inhibitor-like protein 2 n=1 Tax=Poecilia formosa TaxID=48698 RepID=A0A087Y7B3_POEFO